MNSPQSWIETVASLAGMGMQLAAQATLPAALLAAVVLTINLACRRWLTAGQLTLLWTLVLLRLVIPSAPGSSWSLQRFAPLVAEARSPLDLSPQTRDAMVVALPRAHSVAEAAVPAAYYSASIQAASAQHLRIETVLSMLWLSGAIAAGATTLLAHWHVRRELKLATRCDDHRLLQLWADVCHTAGRRRVPEIVFFNGVQQPALVGLFRPQLLLPAETSELSGEQLRMIMLHEAAHLRRYDLAANWLLAVIRAIQWWNPVFWLAARRYASLREQACDAFVVSCLSESERHGYGELLISMAAQGRGISRWRIHLQASLLGFLSSPLHRSVRGRLAALQQGRRRRTRRQLIVGTLLISLLACSGFTDEPILEAQAGQEPQTIAEWMAQSREGGAVVQHALDVQRTVSRSRHRGPLVARTYDLTRVLQQLAIDEPDIAPSVGLKSLLSLLLHPPTPDYLQPARPFDPLQAPKQQFRIEGATLHAFAPESLQEELAACLDAWGDAGLTQICVETRLIRSQHDLAADIGLSWQHFEAFADGRHANSPLTKVGKGGLAQASTTIDECLPVVISKLDQTQATAFLQAAQRRQPEGIPQQPKVTVFNGQTATLADCVQRPFVIGVNYVEGAPGYPGARQPKIEVVETGAQVRFRATHSTDRKRIELQAHIHTADVEHVAQTTAMHRGEAITLQNPRVKRRDVTVAEELADGDSLLVGCLSAADQGEFFYVLLTPQSLTEETSTTDGEASSVVNIAPAGR